MVERASIYLAPLFSLSPTAALTATYTAGVLSISRNFRNFNIPRILICGSGSPQHIIFLLTTPPPPPSLVAGY